MEIVKRAENKIVKKRRTNERKNETFLLRKRNCFTLKYETLSEIPAKMRIAIVSNEFSLNRLNSPLFSSKEFIKELFSLRTTE